MLILALSTSVLAQSVDVSAAVEKPKIKGHLQGVAGSQHKPGNHEQGEAQNQSSPVTSAAAAAPVVTYEAQCSDGETTCYTTHDCVTSSGAVGLWYGMYADGQFVRDVCLTPAQVAAEAPVITPEMVLTEFRRLRWPSAELALQPPNGRTLVNLPTIFSTGLVAAQTQTVTLLGLAVRIEATPVAYTWRAGDGVSWETVDPGSAYTAGVDVDTLNTYTYAAVARVSPSVDVRYHGRYQVQGGPWNDIPQELTVAGAGQPLTVLQAQGLLTGG